MCAQLGYVRHFRDLEVYKKQRVLAKEVFVLTKAFPREEGSWVCARKSAACSVP